MKSQMQIRAARRQNAKILRSGNEERLARAIFLGLSQQLLDMSYPGDLKQTIDQMCKYSWLAAKAFYAEKT